MAEVAIAAASFLKKRYSGKRGSRDPREASLNDVKKIILKFTLTNIYAYGIPVIYQQAPWPWPPMEWYTGTISGYGSIHGKEE
ncbi:MAG: hypothetical protein V4592_05400 [Bacteroidota bacterium]